MNYPLSMSFKILALAPQIKVVDAAGNTVCYVKQKLFKLKEAVNVFKDESQQDVLCQIKADRVIDFSACYHFSDSSGETFGGVRRKGMRSIWKAHYEIMDEENNHVATIQEENPLAKVGDSLLGEIPILGMFTGYLFHPKYLLTTADGQPSLRLTKQPAMWEGRYSIDKLVEEYDPVEELRALMSFIMMTLLERRRG